MYRTRSLDPPKLARQPAQRPSPLLGVRIARQPVVLDASQLPTTYQRQSQSHSAIRPVYLLGRKVTGSRGRTVIGAARHASPTLAVDIAHVLFEGCVGDAAGAVGHGTACVLRCWSCGGNGEEREESCEGELHDELLLEVVEVRNRPAVGMYVSRYYEKRRSD